MLDTELEMVVVIIGSASSQPYRKRMDTVVAAVDLGG